VIGRRLLAAAAVVALAAGGAGAYLALRPAGGAAAGPLAPGAGYYALDAGLPVDVRKPLSYGLLSVDGVRGRTLTLEGVELVGADPALRVVGAYVQPVDVAPSLIMVRGFPPPNPGPDRTPLAGYRLLPGGRVHVVVGLEVVSAGVHGFRAVRLDYRDGSRRYAAQFPLSGTVCAPRHARCEAPRG
jgi:hypothetical protein